MILIAGLSPAWQQLVELSRLTPGEVNRAQAVHWCASGKVVNVALAVHQLLREGNLASPSSATQRIRSQLLTVGGGTTGELLHEELQALGLACTWIPTATATRVCTTLVERESRISTEIVENCQPLLPQEWDVFRRQYAELASQAQVVVLTGSFPAGVPEEGFAELLKLTEGPAIIDAQGAALRRACAGKPFLVKPNREELLRTVYGTRPGPPDLWEAMRSLQREGAGNVLVTQGAGPVLLLSESGRYEFEPPAVPLVNSIACGDCLAAGLACGLAANLELPAAVAWGMGAAAENAQTLLPARFDARQLSETAARIAWSRLDGN